jgi:2,3-bisphosphoglycerate-independent phosphoglycerate mutase
LTRPRPFLLAILDGWGERRQCEGNAIKEADTPVMDGLESKYPHTTLGASGPAVGLPDGQMGNSEVGHLNIGAGRTVYQDFERINLSIRDDSFYRNEVLLSAIEHAAKNGSTLHLMGLLSDGGVHSHIHHLFALLKMAERAGVDNVCTHAFLDGRDVPPRSAGKYIEMMKERTEGDGRGKIRTIQGRYYAMDRDNRWDREKLAYDAIVHAEGPTAATALDAVKKSYGNGVNDEFLIPTIVGERAPMVEEDAVIFFNFRPDRARQLTAALIEKDFKGFDRGEAVFPYVVTMTCYDDDFDVSCAFGPEKIAGTLADVLAANGMTQLHIAETEKYAHVTYFFNGGVEEPKKGEDRVLIQSPHVATYDLKPEMSAPEVASEAVRRIESGKYDFIVLNFANCDMVGHSGMLAPTIKAVETVDACLGKVLDALFKVGGACFVTADHGNADEMSERGQTCTAHSMARVPFIDATSVEPRLSPDGVLGDIAPTILEVLGIPKPPEMTGRSLFI